MASLEILEPASLRAVYPLTKPSTLIGRYPFCDILLESGTISRSHARLTKTDQGFLLEDLNSINGTFLNDRPLYGQTLLNDRDRIRFYEISAVFHDEATKKSAKNPRSGNDTQNGSGNKTPTFQQQPGIPSVRKRTHYLDNPGEAQPHLFSQGKFQSLLGVIQKLGGSLRLDEILTRILDGVFRVYPQSRRGLIWILNESGKLVLRASKQGGSETICSDTLGPISMEVANQVMTGGEAILTVEEANEDWAESIFDIPLRSSMCLPLHRHNGEAMGVLYLDASDAEDPFAEIDLEVVTSVLTVAMQAVEFAQQHEMVIHQHDIIRMEQERRQHAEKELQSARIVQDQLYPSSWPKLKHFELSGATFPAEMACGDYYDWIPLNDDEFVIAVGDVSGHGLRAALRMIEARAYLRSLLEQHQDLEEVISRLNRYLHRSFSLSPYLSQYLTLFLARINVKTRELVYCGAGQEAYLLSDDETILTLESTGQPLGLMEDSRIPLSGTYRLQPGQILAFPTDGISETMNGESTFYGKPRLWNVILENRTRPAGEIVQTVYNSVREFGNEMPQADDLTLMILRSL